MQTKNHLSRPNCASLIAIVAAASLLALSRPAAAQSIMCLPASQSEDNEEVVVILDGDKERDGGILWFLAAGLPALLELFHHGGGSHDTPLGSVRNPDGISGGSGSAGSWGNPGGNHGGEPGGGSGDFPGGGPGGSDGGNPGGDPIGELPTVIQPTVGPAAVPEPGQLAYVFAPILSAAFLLRRRAVRSRV